MMHKKESRPPWALLNGMAALAAAFSLFAAVQSFEYAELQAEVRAAEVRLAAAKQRAADQQAELERLKGEWRYSHFSGDLPADVQGIVWQEAARQGIDPALVLAVIAQESAGRKDAKSRAGALGLMQLMPATAKDLRVNPRCPRQNVKGGVAYLKRLLHKYGDVRLALAAYNWGPGNVDAWLKTGLGSKGQPMPRETQEYAPGVLARIQRVNLLAGL